MAKPVELKDDPNYLFKTAAEGLEFFGATEQEKIGNAIMFSRLRGIVQRLGQQITADEFDTIKLCMQNCIAELP